MGFVFHHLINTVSFSGIKQSKEAGVLVRYDLLRACVWGVINASEREEEEEGASSPKI